MEDKMAPSASPSLHRVLPLPLLLIFYLEITHALSYSQNHSCSSDDLRALRAFSLSDANSGSCCSWPGVHCGLLSVSRPSLNSTTPVLPARVTGLDLSGMGLQGVIPSSISGLDKLAFLNLSTNSLRGSIPPELFLLKLLAVLDLSHNQFSGGLPLGIRNLSALRYLDVSNNRLTGEISGAVFQSLPELEVFVAESNRFSGGLPASLSACPNLTMLDMRNNSLRGTIDLNFARLLRLTKLDLGMNRLRGLIPEALSSCKSLKILNLSRNNLSGQIPKKLCELKALYFLNLGLNGFSNISEAFQVLQECHNLTVLDLSWNFQGEKMPAAEIRGLEKIRALGMANCSLTGSIPSWLKNLKLLRVLDLRLNCLSGEIPAWIGDFTYLFWLNLSNNQLEGEIPISFTSLKSFASAITFNDDASSPLDPPILSWSKKSIVFGGIVYKHYKDFAPSLNLRHNRLNGSIWGEFGELRYLHHLDLSWNNLSGIIPEELSRMISLERLDLSHNKLSGSIPFSLTRLTFLSLFNVSYNHLEGLIPVASQFSTFPCWSFEGNPSLHGNSPPFCNSNLNTTNQEEEEEGDDGGYGSYILYGLPFAIGLVAGFLPTVYLLIL